MHPFYIMRYYLYTLNSRHTTNKMEEKRNENKKKQLSEHKMNVRNDMGNTSYTLQQCCCHKYTYMHSATTLEHNNIVSVCKIQSKTYMFH